MFEKPGPVGLSDDASELLEAYSWPGNVRELENAVKSAIVLAETMVYPGHLPEEIRDGAMHDAIPSAAAETTPRSVATKIQRASSSRESRMSLP